MTTPTETRTPTRAEKLAAWFSTPEASYLRAPWRDIRLSTIDTYGDDPAEADQPFAVVEKLELPGHDDVIVSFCGDERLAAEHVAELLECSYETSWFPHFVLDLDADSERAVSLDRRTSVTFIRKNRSDQ